MSDIWSYVKQLFKKSEESSSSNPFIHEVIKRKEEEKEDYIRWKKSLIKRRLIDWIRDQYAVYQVNPDHLDQSIDFLNTPSSNGFVIYFNQTNYNKEEITHLFDYMKEQVLQLNYKTYVSDRRIYNKKDWVENIDRHYLKPKPNFMANEKLNQQFGNITIELLLRNENVVNLKFSATHYQDSKYKEVAEFSQLIQHLIK